VDRGTAGRRNVLTHLTAAVVVPGCIALCWWQVTRALAGNTLSWAYVFEWPIFAGYGVFMWWRLIHEPRDGGHDPQIVEPPADVTGIDDPRMERGAHGDSGAGDGSGVDAVPGEDEELASYNRYLAALNASGRRKHW